MIVRSWIRKVGSALAVTLLIVGASIAHGQPRAIRRSFLVASDAIRDPFFRESVILMLPRGRTALIAGLIINKPTTLTLRQLFPSSRALKNRTDRVYFGGPVDTRSPAVVLRGSPATKGMLPLFDDVYASLNPGLVTNLMQGKEVGRDLRLYVGRAQWAPAQLDNERLRGDWYVVPADAAAVFSMAPDTIWQKLFARTQLLRAAATTGESRFLLFPFRQNGPAGISPSLAD